MRVLDASALNDNEHGLSFLRDVLSSNADRARAVPLRRRPAPTVRNMFSRPGSHSEFPYRVTLVVSVAISDFRPLHSQ